MTLYQEGVTRLADSAGAAVLRVPEAAPTVIDVAHSRAYALSDVALAAALTDAGHPVQPVGLVPESIAPRIEKALATIRDTVPDDEARLSRTERLARLTVIEGAADGWRTGLRRHGITHYTRRTSINACKICAPRAGETLSVNFPVQLHKGCSCVMEPAV